MKDNINELFELFLDYIDEFYINGTNDLKEKRLQNGFNKIYKELKTLNKKDRNSLTYIADIFNKFSIIEINLYPELKKDLNNIIQEEISDINIIKKEIAIRRNKIYK